MRFLEPTYVWDWCRTHGFTLVEGEPRVSPRLASDSALVYRQRNVHGAAGKQDAAELLAAEACLALGAWDSCLAWVTDWDVWEDQEDWPRFYGWRGEHNERRSLVAVPGHLFESGEASELTAFVARAIEWGWDVSVLPTLGGVPTRVRLNVSHDEWIAIESTQPVSFMVPAG